MSSEVKLEDLFQESVDLLERRHSIGGTLSLTGEEAGEIYPLLELVQTAQALPRYRVSPGRLKSMAAALSTQLVANGPATISPAADSGAAEFVNPAQGRPVTTRSRSWRLPARTQSILVGMALVVAFTIVALGAFLVIENPSLGTSPTVPPLPTTENTATATTEPTATLQPTVTLTPVPTVTPAPATGEPSTTAQSGPGTAPTTVDPTRPEATTGRQVATTVPQMIVSTIAPEPTEAPRSTKAPEPTDTLRPVTTAQPPVTTGKPEDAATPTPTEDGPNKGKPTETPKPTDLPGQGNNKTPPPTPSSKPDNGNGSGNGNGNDNGNGNGNSNGKK